MSKVRVRYAPSPTGFLHIGNARTALFDYLFAKHHDGTFVLRIEDTDVERNVEGGEESQLFYLNWLGIEPDESAQKPNPKYGPYRQTERLDIYKKYVDILLEKGYAYKCFCTSEEIEEDYNRQIEAGVTATRYNRKCLNLTKEEIKQKEEAGIPYSIRLKVPNHKTYEFEDLIRGHVSFESKDIGDFVIVKSNGIPTYNFAVVVDDHLMEISHVFRGEEHISNTPKQLMIYEMLGWEAPKFGHMTIIVNENHKKLSKRDNSIMQFMSQYKEAGYLPEAMVNFLALLGWSPSGEQEIFSMEELIKEFDETRLSKSPSMFDKSRLTWVNNRYIKNLSEDEFFNLCYPFLNEAYDLSNINEQKIKEIINSFKEELSYGKEIVEKASIYFVAPDYSTLEGEAKEIFSDESVNNTLKVFKEEIEKFEVINKEDVKGIVKATQVNANVKGKMLYMPLRIALTNEMHGPDFSSLVYLLGKEEIINRLNKVIK